MLKFSWILFVFFTTAVLLLGVFLGRITVRKPDTAIVLDTLIVYDYKDTTIVKDTVITAHDTVYIDSTTPLGAIPVRTQVEKDSLPIRVGKQIIYAPYHIGTQYRGILYQMWMQTDPVPYDIELKADIPPVIDFYGQALIAIDVRKELLSEVEFGATFKQKASLAIGVRASRYPVEATAYVGLRYTFF
jgi:hypothetical protein